MKTTITRRTALAVPVTLPLLPVSAYAGAAVVANSEEDGGFQEILANLEKMHPKDRQLIIDLTRTLAEIHRKRRAGAA